VRIKLVGDDAKRRCVRTTMLRMFDIIPNTQIVMHT